MFEKCKQNQFYLGLFKHISDEYRYNWVNDIIYYKSGTKMKNITNKKNIFLKNLKQIVGIIILEIILEHVNGYVVILQIYQLKIFMPDILFLKKMMD